MHSELVDVLAAPQNSSHTAPSLRVLLTGCGQRGWHTRGCLTVGPHAQEARARFREEHKRDPVIWLDK